MHLKNHVKMKSAHTARWYMKRMWSFCSRES